MEGKGIMKITMTLAIAGLVLFIFSIGASIAPSCFHCVMSFTINPESMVLASLSMGFLGFAFFRLFKTLSFIQLNSYSTESLVNFTPYDFYLIPQHKPVYYANPLDVVF